MNLLSLVASLTIDTSDYDKGLKDSKAKAMSFSSTFKSGMSKLGSAVKTTVKGIAVGMTTASAAVVAVGKKALDAYADYEQLAGGVETLFGKSSNTVIENAQKAYKTAGLSANQYMETVTSFSSSLIQSLGRGAQTNLETLKGTLDKEYTTTKRTLEDSYEATKTNWQKKIALAKSSGNANVDALKEQMAAELKELKRANTDQLAALKQNNKEKLAEAKSANESSVTSAKSLSEAARLSDQIVVDMSDNANKMGSDVSSIQAAFAGFAKGNFTMLDNLKLGYGGTKEEMERLLRDAEKISGVKYDVSSFADIAEAIHVVQTEMGIAGYSTDELSEKLKNNTLTQKEMQKIADDMGISYGDVVSKIKNGSLTVSDANVLLGTTAREASTTIQGSLGSAKAAWQNLLTGLADNNADLDKLVNNFFDSIVTVGENILPRISVILNGIVSLVEKLAPKIIKEIPKLINQLLPVIVSGAKGLLSAVVSVLPQLAKSLLAALPSLISSITEVFKGIVDALPRLMETITSALPTLIPQIITALVDMTTYLLEHIGEILQPIIDNLPDILISIVNAVMDNLPVLIEGLITATLAIVDAIPEIILGLIDALPTVIDKIITGLMGCIPQLIEGLIRLDAAVVMHLPEIIMGLISAIPTIISSIVKALFSAAPKLWSSLSGIFSKAWDGIKNVFSGVGDWFKGVFSKAWDFVKGIWSGAGDWFKGIWKGIVNAFSVVGNWFKNTFSGAWDGIKNAWSGVVNFFGKIWDGIKNAFGAVTGWFKDIFSKAWQAVKNVFSTGGKVFEGIKDGIVTAFKTVVNAIIRGINKVITVPFDAINGILDGIRSIEIVGIKPFDWIGELPVPQIPELARGGVVNKPTFAMFGEDGAEAVVPLEKNTGWIKEIAKQLNDYRSDIPSIVLNVNNPVVREEEDIDKIANAVSETLADRILRSGMSWGGSYA